MSKKLYAQRNCVGRTIRQACVAIAAISIILMAGCSNSDTHESHDPLTSILASMKENPKFSIGSDTESQGRVPPYQFVLPDRMSYWDWDAYDKMPYMIAIGSDAYVSEDGVHWEEGFWSSNGIVQFLRWNPYQYLAHATNPVETGKETMSGRKCRTVEAEVDLDTWAQDNAPTPTASMHLEDLTVLNIPDPIALEAAGYELLLHGDDSLTALGPEAYVEVDYEEKGDLFAEIKSVPSSTAEFEEKLDNLLILFGLEPPVWESAPVRVWDNSGFFSAFAGETMSARLKSWVDEKTYLPYRLEIEWIEEFPEGQQKTMQMMDISYDDSITIEQPETVIHTRKFEMLYGAVQDQARELVSILDIFREANGHFPGKLDPETIMGILATGPFEWPVNPYTDEPMEEHEGTSGNYHYELMNSGEDYSLIIYNYYSDDGFHYRWSELQAEEAMMREMEERRRCRPESLTDSLTALPNESECPSLTKSQKGEADAIALGAPEVQALLTDTDHTVWDVYPYQSDASCSLAQVVVAYFVKPYKIDFKTLSIVVDLEDRTVTGVSEVPERLLMLLRDEIYDGDFPLTTEARSVVAMVVVDHRLPRLVGGSEYVIAGIRVAAGKGASMTIHLFDPLQVENCTIESVGVRVDLTSEEVTFDVLPAATAIPIDVSTPRQAFAKDRQVWAIEVALADPRIQELLNGKSHNIWQVSPMYIDSRLVGAVTEIRLSEPCIMEYDWPVVNYGKDGSFTESTYHTALRMDRLYVSVDLEEKRVIEIRPF